MDDPQSLSTRIGAIVPHDWPQEDLREALPYFVARLEEDPLSSAWFVWVIVSKADRIVVGDIGFKGRPDAHGTVEIGYSILPAYRNRGFASEAANAMVCLAGKTVGVRKVVAECARDNAPSIRVLAKLNMVRTHEDEGIIRWELNV